MKERRGEEGGGVPCPDLVPVRTVALMEWRWLLARGVTDDWRDR